MDILVQKFSFFGLDGQYWMLAGAAIVGLFAMLAWRSRRRG
ncbi:hypothetical protein [Bradyrhizobium sp. HKCCYLR20261]